MIFIRLFLVGWLAISSARRPVPARTIKRPVRLQAFLHIHLRNLAAVGKHGHRFIAARCDHRRGAHDPFGLVAELVPGHKNKMGVVRFQLFAFLALAASSCHFLDLPAR
jgi:hypothetical protein